MSHSYKNADGGKRASANLWWRHRKPAGKGALQDRTWTALIAGKVHTQTLNQAERPAWLAQASMTLVRRNGNEFKNGIKRRKKHAFARVQCRIPGIKVSHFQLKWKTFPSIDRYTTPVCQMIAGSRRSRVATHRPHRLCHDLVTHFVS